VAAYVDAEARKVLIIDMKRRLDREVVRRHLEEIIARALGIDNVAEDWKFEMLAPKGRRDGTPAPYEGKDDCGLWLMMQFHNYVETPESRVLQFENS
jgi:hypothetical protein